LEEVEFAFFSAFMRRAVPVSDDGSGFADDLADGGAGVAFLRAIPFDEDGAAFGGEGDAGVAEAFEVSGVEVSGVIPRTAAFPAFTAHAPVFSFVLLRGLTPDIFTPDIF
jgi:hypothetical protein